MANGFNGSLGRTTCSIYALDARGTPIERVADVVPGVSPLRVTLDTIDGEQLEQAWLVTRHTLQDLTDTTSNVRAELRMLTVAGVLAAAGPMVIGSGAVRNARLDAIRFANLTALANLRRPVMVVTPRHSLDRAFITGLPASWSPTDGDSQPITIKFLEARVLTSASVASFVDVDASPVGNNRSSGGGAGGSTSVAGEAFGPAGPGIPPLAPY